ncbi:MAG: S46 family peptidase [Culturomica sp.]|jgi:hypothetical protein|nr:S46 family peptidase [Culturomica sp.]
MQKRIGLMWVVALLFQLTCRADEGMWIPLLLKKYNLEEMQRQGFRLTAEDVYDINRAALKDAVVGLGREGRPFSHFCTGELVSREGLLLTNHHCAYSLIQAHSTLTDNYLKDGFWAYNRPDELANPGITASILVRIEDVTQQINGALTTGTNEKERAAIVEKLSRKLEEEAVRGTDLQANVKPYFNGNQYFMSVFRIYRDVRLVGAPPSAIGKFGGDTDNWTWPRHTGDFAFLRIYAGKENAPAAYSPENVPYRPATHFKIATGGVREGDFTFVFGYPASTREYLPSFAAEQLLEIENPHKTAIRTAKLKLIDQAMNSDELLRLKYAAKAAGVANSWKKWQGETKGLTRFGTVEQKRRLEAEFKTWAVGRVPYDGVTDRYEALYRERKELILADAYALEAGLGGAEIIAFARSLTDRLSEMTENDLLPASVDQQIRSFFKNYDAATDQKILSEMLKLYDRQLPNEWKPEAVKESGQKGGYDAYAAHLFHQSFFTDSTRLLACLERWKGVPLQEKLKKDPAYLLASSIADFRTLRISPPLREIENQLRELDRVWLAGLMEMQPDKRFYADANSTLRVAYGKIGGYSPADGIYYRPFTTLSGILEKEDPEIYDYRVPAKLKELYQRKDFGPYMQDGEVPVCFIAGNHTTGGNSGSPVLNAEGHLIGVNFDRAWEGVMSDVQYEPSICRNISVDIRYVLFIVDKFAEAGHLIREMELVE